jgi:hypothetical protein
MKNPLCYGEVHVAFNMYSETMAGATMSKFTHCGTSILDLIHLEVVINL